LFDASELKKLSNLETFKVCPKEMIFKAAIIIARKAGLFILVLSFNVVDGCFGKLNLRGR